MLFKQLHEQLLDSVIYWLRKAERPTHWLPRLHTLTVTTVTPLATPLLWPGPVLPLARQRRRTGCKQWRAVCQISVHLKYFATQISLLPTNKQISVAQPFDRSSPSSLPSSVFILFSINIISSVPTDRHANLSYLRLTLSAMKTERNIFVTKSLWVRYFRIVVS